MYEITFKIIIMTTKKHFEKIKHFKLVNRVCNEVSSFEAMYRKYERNMSILDRSPKNTITMGISSLYH